MNTTKNPNAVALGRLGGSRNTDAQNKARGDNARKRWAGHVSKAKTRKRKIVVAS